MKRQERQRVLMAGLLRLRYGALLVGRVSDSFFSDDTWYGVFESDLKPESSPTAGRLAEFIAFCEAWHRRLDENPGSPPDADEFDRYSDIIESDLWTACAEGGEEMPVFRAPVFYSGQVSWRPA